MIPPRIGLTVRVEGKEAWLCQRRIGDEQFVLWWGGLGQRYRAGDRWEKLNHDQERQETHDDETH